MRMLDVFQKPDYEPLERGCAFVQYHEDGDRYSWHHPFCWHWDFWNYMVWNAASRRDDDCEIFLMGGEL